MIIIYNGKEFKDESGHLKGWINNNLAHQEQILRAVGDILESQGHELIVMPCYGKINNLITPKNLRIEKHSLTIDVTNDDYRWVTFYISPKENRMPAPFLCAKAALKVLQRSGHNDN